MAERARQADIPNTEDFDDGDMSPEIEGFELVESDIPKPTRKARANRYARTVEKFIESGAKAQRIVLRDPVTAAEVNPKSAVPGFRNVIGRSYAEDVRLVQRQNALYLERLHR